MPKYGAVAAFLLLVFMVLCRITMMKRHGLQAFVFAKTQYGEEYESYFRRVHRYL